MNVMCDRHDVVGLVLVAIQCISGGLNNAVRYLRVLLLLLLSLLIYFHTYHLYAGYLQLCKVKVKESRYRPGVAQRVPGS